MSESQETVGDGMASEGHGEPVYLEVLSNEIFFEDHLDETTSGIPIMDDNSYISYIDLTQAVETETATERFHRLKKEATKIKQRDAIINCRQAQTSQEILDGLKQVQKVMDKAQRNLDNAEKLQETAEVGAKEAKHYVEAGETRLRKMEQFYEDSKKLCEAAERNRGMAEVQVNLVYQRQRGLEKRVLVVEESARKAKKDREDEEKRILDVTNMKINVHNELIKLQKKIQKELIKRKTEARKRRTKAQQAKKKGAAAKVAVAERAAKTKASGKKTRS